MFTTALKELDRIDSVLANDKTKEIQTQHFTTLSQVMQPPKQLNLA